MEHNKYFELIPSLPEELGLECLSRLHYTTHRVASRVCHRWLSLLKSREFYQHRKKLGYTHMLACFVQAFNDESIEKPSRPPSYGISVFDSTCQTWDRINPIPKYPNGLPLFCQLAGCGETLVVMGGWDPVTYEPVTDVFLYDFRCQLWRQGKEMPSKRSFFAIGGISGRVFVAGGHDENKNASKTSWVYDLNRNEWTELTQMSQERDECEGIIVGNKFWVVSGYQTDNQGAFNGSAEVYDLNAGLWTRVEDAWEVGKCPRSRVGVAKGGQLINWAEMDSAVRVGTCRVGLGCRNLITGSEYQGASHGFYVVEESKTKFMKINVPDEFSGFVQTGCTLEG